MHIHVNSYFYACTCGLKCKPINACIQGAVVIVVINVYNNRGTVVIIQRTCSRLAGIVQESEVSEAIPVINVSSSTKNLCEIQLTL